MDVQDDAACFVCGRENPRGLGLSFSLDREAGRARAEWVFPAWCQGWSGMVHGGLLSSVLDELCIKPAEALGLSCVTASLEVRFRQPVLTGHLCRGEGLLTERRGRVLKAISRICTAEGAVCAEAVARLVVVDASAGTGRRS